jgi:hypothetical protein
MEYIKAKKSIKRNQGSSLVFFYKNRELTSDFLIKFRGSRQRFFFNTEPGKCQNFALALSQSLGNLSRLFSPHLTLQSSILLLLFQPDFIHRVEFAFSKSN